MQRISAPWCVVFAIVGFALGSLFHALYTYQRPAAAVVPAAVTSGNRVVVFGSGMKTDGPAEVWVFDREDGFDVMIMETPVPQPSGGAAVKGSFATMASRDGKTVRVYLHCVPARE